MNDRIEALVVATTSLVGAVLLFGFAADPLHNGLVGGIAVLGLLLVGGVVRAVVDGAL